MLCYEGRYTKLALRKTGITQTVRVTGMLRVTTHVTRVVGFQCTQREIAPAGEYTEEQMLLDTAGGIPESWS